MSTHAQHVEAIPPTGLTVVVPHADPALDVVFVHGFTGHPEHTWAHEGGGFRGFEYHHDGQSEPPSKSRRLNNFFSDRRNKDSAHCTVFWPRDLLPATVPDARVLTYGYDTHIRHWAGQQANQSSIRDIAWNFLVALTASRREEPTRPLVFVVHSLGGIIVKELLRRSNGCRLGQPDLRKVFEATKGILFFGTPHHGADLRGFLLRVAKFAATTLGFNFNENIINSLRPSSERLDELRDEFTPLATDQKWIIHSFQEQLGVAIFGGRKVVEDHSSRLQLAAIETAEHIGRNHMEMCRFSSPEDVEYKKVAAALERIVASLPENPAPASRSAFTEEQRKQLRDSLKFEQIDARHTTIKKAHTKTCKWLKKKNEYVDWIDLDKFHQCHGFLWIKGKPGTGKSTLMKFALAQARTSMNDSKILAFFFNARGESLEKTTLGMYRSLLLQLLDKIPALNTVFESCLTVWPKDGQVEWSVELLKDLFEQAIRLLGRSRVVCFIDALDECDEDQVRDMLSFFEHTGELAAESDIQFRICFSSRHYPNITITHGLKLVLEGQEGHDQDITNYIDSELKIGYSKPAEKIRDELREKASGVFMWVVLVVGILNKEFDRGRIHALRRRLREIPAGLHELFRDILLRDTRDRDDLTLCIQWILFAKRPMKPEELYFAVLASKEAELLEPWDWQHNTLEIIRRFILDSSKGLAETTRSKTPVVQFIHESVRDFLLKENSLEEIWPDLSGRFCGRSHEQLKSCCLGYVSSATDKPSFSNRLSESDGDPATLRVEIQETYPFLEYATRNVLCHANEAESEGISQHDWLPNFPLDHWTKLDNVFEKFKVRRHSPETNIFCILAEKNLASLIKAHFTSHPLEPAKGRYGNPFYAAIVTGSTEAVRALAGLGLKHTNSSTLFRKLCQDYTNNPNQIPRSGHQFCVPGGLDLKKAARHGDAEWFRLLAAIGMGKTHEDNDGWSTILWAFENGKPGLIETLLSSINYGADLGDEASQEILMLAIQYGHLAITKKLLEMGQAEVNLQDQDGNTPLSLAAKHGHLAIVKLLLETGQADIDSKGLDGKTSLSLAAKHGHLAIVKLLLEISQIKVNLKDQYGKTPLFLAVEYGHLAITKLLLETGQAEFNSKNRYGKTPLLIAAEKGHPAIVKLLLETEKVDVDSRDDCGRTPVSYAAKWGHREAAKLLLETGKVDIESRDHLGRTPLSYAAGREKALFYAAEREKEEIAKLLLETGKVDADSRDDYGRTPLSYAAASWSGRIVKLLLKTGKVDVNSRDGHGRTPLSYAAEIQNGKAVELLLKTGKVDVESRDDHGRTPLSYAAGGQNKEIAELLLKTGKVDVESRDDQGRMPLSYVAEWGRGEIVKLLKAER